jgi:hypothetical protein
MKQAANRDDAEDDDMFLRNVCWLSRTTRRYISEDRILHSHSGENIRFSIFILKLWSYEIINTVNRNLR